jgi:hypothetical protein
VRILRDRLAAGATNSRLIGKVCQAKVMGILRFVGAPLAPLFEVCAVNDPDKTVSYRLSAVGQKSGRIIGGAGISSLNLSDRGDEPHGSLVASHRCDRFL